MGILTRRQGDAYVITSDRVSHAVPLEACPGRLSDVYQVWTSSGWSTEISAALLFRSMDEADEYIRTHYAQITG